MGLGRLNPGCGCECPPNECDMVLEPCQLTWDCTGEDGVRVSRNGVVISTAKRGIIPRPDPGTWRLEKCTGTACTWTEVKSISIPGPVNYSGCFTNKPCCEILQGYIPTTVTVSGYPSPLTYFNGTYGLSSGACGGFYEDNSKAMIYEYIDPHVYYPWRYRMFRESVYVSATALGFSGLSARVEFNIKITNELFNGSSWQQTYLSFKTLPDNSNLTGPNLNWLCQSSARRSDTEPGRSFYTYHAPTTLIQVYPTFTAEYSVG
jgi:hypothetical protein